MNIVTFPDSPYLLHQPFEPAGDQPAAIAQLRDVYIEKDSSINEQIEQMRLSATKALLEREDSVIYGIGDPVDYHGMILHLRHNEIDF